MKESEHSDAPGKRRRDGPSERSHGSEQERPTRKEIGGPDGPEPTRYGDWERNGRCTDF